MAKTLRTSGDYTVKAGAGYDSGSGSNTIRLDARYIRIPGDLTVEGTQTVIDSQTLSVEDQFIEVNRNNSTAGTEDSGIFFNQGSSNNQILYYDADQSEFVFGSTTHSSSVSSITNITPGKIRLADPVESDHAATKSYVDAQVVAGAGISSFDIVGEDSTGLTVNDGDDITITGGTNMNVVVTDGPGTITLSLDPDLSNITSITSNASNGNLELVANGTGTIVVNDVLTFSGAATTPTASTVTKLYNKTAAGGGTGLYFINSNISSGTEGELISKKKATALAIALG